MISLSSFFYFISYSEIDDAHNDLLHLDIW